jgi:hypothetical protein
VLPREGTAAGQLEVLTQDTCPELLDWIHVECKFTHLFQDWEGWWEVED